jgi:NTP pyrophosphatase (non-canonical NTP hydrolase)
MTQQITTTEYANFVTQVTSKTSSDVEALKARIDELHEQGVSVPQLLTSAYGLSAEAGEFTDLIKKILWQSKPYNEENIIKMKKELGDVQFYVQMACTALGVSLDEVIQMNFEKLSARYPEGTFVASRSENREEGDV